MTQLKVDRESRLLDFLFRVLKDTKKTRVRQLLKFRHISVNGLVVTRYDCALKAGDEVSIQSAREKQTISPRYGVRIIYEDDFIVVAEKPSGLLTIATEKVQRRTALFAVNDYLNRKEMMEQNRRSRRGFKSRGFGKKIFIVHRLDKETSGLIVFARTAGVKERMQENWKFVFKEYDAFVEGIPKKREGTMTSYLKENKTLRMTASPEEVPGSKYAVTHYTVVQEGPVYSLLKIRPETGRKHQIRVHLACLGCPVAGDKDYGSRFPHAGRLALHASRLAFNHPVTGKRMDFKSELPAAFKDLLKVGSQSVL